MRGRVLLVVGLLIGVIWSYGKTRVPIDEHVQTALADAAHSETGAILTLSELTDYYWTQLCIVEAYSERRDVEELVNARWPYWWVPQLHDGQTRLVFMDGNQVVGVAESTSARLRFSRSAPGCYNPISAVFRIEEREFNGTRYRVMAPFIRDAA